MKEKPFFLSIIVIGYNTSSALTKCLHSLNLQKLDGFDAEIIYVDDGSIDDSVKIFNNFPLKRINFKRGFSFFGVAHL